MIEAGDWSGELFFATAAGLVKRTLRADMNVRKAKFAAISLKNGDKLMAALRTGRL